MTARLRGRGRLPGAGLLALAMAGALGVFASVVPPAGASSARCGQPHWVGAWQAPPSDASRGSGIGDVFAPSEDFPPGSAGDKKLPVDDSTVRVVLTPSLGGTILRVHLSNRFGTAPVTFTHVTVGRQAEGATLAGPAALVTFAGKPSVTAPAGQDVVSDAVEFSYRAFENLAVSVFVRANAGMPTEHYEGRQTSYFTPDEAGDHAADTNGSAFLLYNSTRPYVDGLDVLAPSSAGAVVAFGDSITDGYQGDAPAGIPANPQGLNQNRRYPDDLARRLISAHIPLSVVNAGISGNRVLLDGAVGGNPDTYGSAGLSRLSADVLGDAGATTVIWLEGINDIGQAPYATAAQIEAGYVKGIAEMHAAGLKVLIGTLTPSGGDVTSSYGDAAANAEREQVNDWIRAKSPADGVIDFDAAVRDPSDPSRINPAYDGGDHLHFNPAGYQAMANAIDLALLRRATCVEPRLHVIAEPTTVRAGRTARLVVRVTTEGASPAPVSGALVRVAGRRGHTNRRGVTVIALVLRSHGAVRITAVKPGYRPAGTTVQVVAARGPSQRPRRALGFTG